MTVEETSTGRLKSSGSSNKKMTFAMKRLIASAVFFLVMVISAFVIDRTKGFDHRHIFINLTSDHRFDSSIRLSILSQYKKLGVENAVVISNEIPDGLTIEEWAVQLFEKLRLGRATDGKAILYVSVPSKNQFKVEVAYGLEGALPDVKVRELEAAAKSYTFADRYQDFWAELLITVGLQIENAQEGKSFDLAKQISFVSSRSQFQSGGAGIIDREASASADQLRREARSMEKGDTRFEPSRDIQLTIDRYLQSMQLGIGDANLPLLSTGSRLMRLRLPQTMAQLQRNAEMLEKAKPFKITRVEGKSVAFPRQGYAVLPIVLIMDDKGAWRVHEPNSWSYFHRFENSTDLFQKFRRHPFDQAFAQAYGATKSRYYIYDGAAPARSFLNDDRDFFSTFERLENGAKSGEAMAVFDLADFYYFEMYWTEKALSLYQKGLVLDSAQANYRWRMLDLLLNLGFIDEYLKQMQQLTQEFPRNSVLQRDYDFYRTEYVFPESQWRSSIH